MEATRESTIFERINELCKKNNTTITTLCKEVTGSSGNLSTWKKDNIRPYWLISISQKFNVSADFLLTGNCLSTKIDYSNNSEEKEFLSMLRQLSENDKEEIMEIMLLKLKRSQKSPEKNTG